MRAFRHIRPLRVLLTFVILSLALGWHSPAPAGADPPSFLPPNFQAQPVFQGLVAPMAAAFSPDGRVFVAEQAGIIKVFDSLSDATPNVFADLTAEVHGYWDRGLMDLALDPQFPTRPYIYVAYALDAPIGGTPPVWNDACGDAPTTEGCPIGGRISRLTASGNAMVTGSEKVLVEAFCQQFPSHSLGHLQFGPDGYLYMSAGEGAAFESVLDYGELGNPANPCGDPPRTAGTPLAPPDAQGGALRAQSPRRPAGQPRSLSGTLIRIDPETGQGAPGNPFASSDDPNARRIIAYGMRNPFRFTFRPGTHEIWLGDVDWYAYEELNLVADVGDGVAENFGWPCYQGTERQPGYSDPGINLSMCQTLPVSGVTFPYFFYRHAKELVDGDGCGTNRSSITGLAYYAGTSYPATYRDALFVGDYSRNCIWFMRPGPDGRPDPSTAQLFMRGVQGTDSGGPVQITTGPGGDLFYVDYLNGDVYRVRYFPGNEPPIVKATASPTNGKTLPLTVNFSSFGSGDPDAGDSVSYAWDLDGDGQFDDSAAANPVKTYATAGIFDARLKVTDSHGLSTVSSKIRLAPGHEPPSVQIGLYGACATPVPCWAVGDQLRFTSTAIDETGTPVGPANVSWKLVMNHCTTVGSLCHQHVIFQNYTDYGGMFPAPDHEYPSYLELTAVATDANGLASTTTRRLDPIPVQLTVTTAPAGLKAVVAGHEVTTPSVSTFIRRTTATVSVDPIQVLNGKRYDFLGWADGGAPSHAVQVTLSRTLTARFAGPASVAFRLPRVTRARRVPVSWTGTAGATKYLLREGVGGPPPAASPLWRTARPAGFRISVGDGRKVIRAWALNAAGRPSPVAIRSVVLDTTPPTVRIAGPAQTTKRVISIRVRANDSNGIAGYFIAQARRRPTPNAPGWRPTAPTFVRLAGPSGPKTLYLWVKDAAGNVSAVARLEVVFGGSG